MHVPAGAYLGATISPGVVGHPSADGGLEEGRHEIQNIHEPSSMALTDALGRRGTPRPSVQQTPERAQNTPHRVA